MLRNGIHLAVLSALAVAQPVLDILGKNPAFFSIRDSSTTQIVLFALVVVLGPPLLLVMMELAARAFSSTAARVLHLVFVGALVALLALYVLTKSGVLSGPAALAAAAVAGALAALVYERAAAARFLLTVLAPVPLVLVALFLFQSPVSKLVFADEPEVQAATVEARTPVVFIAFDEFSTVALMNRRQEIDARRFPNFAALARDSLWFRDATTMYWLSEVAVPSLLSGLRPVPGKVPIASEYPRNLFTLLGGSYQMHVVEALTQLCPRSVCGETRTEETQVVPGEAGSLASDAGVVYLHLLLPEPYVNRVPPIDDAWGNFGQDEAEREEPVQRTPSGEIEACGRNICRFAELISADRRPTLYFVDSLLPHVPYVYLPSGRRYTVDARILRGIDNGLWLEPWPALQGYQRYLLQTGYTDAALGVLLRRLRATGVYDRALVIVTADHGVGFRPGDQRRLPTPTNLHEIAFVPLFVKLPDQREGRIVDGLATTLDVLPTIADVLGVPLDWSLDGHPLVGRPLARDGTVTVLKQDGSPVSERLSVLRARRERALAAQIEAFGTGSFSRVYRIGPNRELLGRRLESLAVRPGGDVQVEIDGRTLLDAVDRASGFVPSFIEGSLSGATGRSALAVALNGTIAAVTWTFDQRGQTRFSAFVPENALQDGRNAIEVFAVRRPGPSLQLDRLEGSDLTFSLRPDAIVSPARQTPIQSRALLGAVRVSREGTGFVFSGWAAQRGTNRPVNTLAVFVDGRAVYVGRAENLKQHAVLGEAALGKTGFAFELPPGLLPNPGGTASVRVFALGQGVASELNYLGEYPWRRD